MAFRSPYAPPPVMSHAAYRRYLADVERYIADGLEEKQRREAYVRECQRQEAVQHATASPPPLRQPCTIDEAYAWLLKGRDVEATLLKSLMRAEDEAKERVARERREAEWPIGDWGLSYQGEDRVKTASESLGE